MQRHSGLRDLSHDHHHGLVHARRLKGTGENARDTGDCGQSRDIALDFLQFWREHVNTHFREEEEILLPMFARFGEIDQPPINQMLREHIIIRRHVRELQEQLSAPVSPEEKDSSLTLPDPQTLLSLGLQLEQHIRLEERVIFPLIEATVSEEILISLPNLLMDFRNMENNTEPDLRQTDNSMS